MGDHRTEVLAKIAHDLSDAFREKLFALGYQHVSVTYSPKAPKGDPEQLLPDYSPADVKASLAAHAELVGPMGPRGVRETVGDRLLEAIKKAEDNGGIDPKNAGRIVDEILEIFYSKFELYRKPVRSKPIDFYGDEYSGEGVWTDPNPTGKFDTTLMHQQLASNYTGPGTKDWAKKQPIVVCTMQNPLFDCQLPFCPNHGRGITIVESDGEVKTGVDPQDTQISVKDPFGPENLENSKHFLIETDREDLLPMLYDNYRRLFPNGGHNCRERECKLLIHDDARKQYGVDHNL